VRQSPGSHQGRGSALLAAARDIDENVWRRPRDALIKTGERNYCWVGERDRSESIDGVRPKMIGSPDGARGKLESLDQGRLTLVLQNFHQSGRP
jgi:hypothetical protein